MELTNTANANTIADYAMEDVIRAMKAMPKLPPKSERIARLRMNDRMIGQFKDQSKLVADLVDSRPDFCGVMVDSDNSLLFGEWILVMEDGSEKFHTPFGPYRQPTGWQPAKGR